MINSSIAKGLIIRLLPFVVAFIFGISCRVYQPAPTPALPPGPALSPVLAPTPTPISKPTPPAAVMEIIVKAKYATFQPSALTVVKGQTVKFIITSTDISHTFTIDELGINISVGRGQTVTKEFVVEKGGTFTFYCAVPGHRDAGMRGTFKVTEQIEQPLMPAPTPTLTPGGKGGGYGY